MEVKEAVQLENSKIILEVDKKMIKMVDRETTKLEVQ